MQIYQEFIGYNTWYSSIKKSLCLLQSAILMKYFVYMILSKINNRLISYVGYTDNLEKRLLLHNSSKGAKFTKGKTWKLIYSKTYYGKSEAMKEEFKLKKDYTKRNIIKKMFLIKNETN